MAELVSYQVTWVLLKMTRLVLVIEKCLGSARCTKNKIDKHHTHRVPNNIHIRN